MKHPQFYMTPGSCSTGIHILLEEVGMIFEATIVNLLAGDHRKPEYLAINPKGSVPAFQRTDGTVLTDFLSIALWLAEAYPKQKLLLDSEEDRAKAVRLMEYAIGVVHGEGFTRIFVTDSYADNAKERAQVEGEGVQIVTRGFARLEGMIRGPRYVFERFTIADAALFYVEFWADHLNMALPSKCKAHFLAMLQRPSVRQVLSEEGYAKTLSKHDGSGTRFSA